VLCFALWTLLDANQLFREASISAPGGRRTAAMMVLRPVAAVANALHLSGLVNWGNSELGHSAGPGGNQNLPPPVITVPTIPPPNHFENGTNPLPHGLHKGVFPVIPPPPVVPVVPQPTPGDRLTILDIGDSIGEDLGFGVGDIFTGDPYVNVRQEGVINTGLANPRYYDWPGHLEQYLEKYHPGAVIIMMGANDDTYIDGTRPGTSAWVKLYRPRVAILMEECLAARARVIWVGLPPMGGGNITNAFVKQVNSIYVAEARLHPGVTYFSSWNLLAGPHGKFTEYLKINGSEVQVRYPDGLHLAPAGWDLLARALVQPMQQAWHVNLHVAP